MSEQLDQLLTPERRASCNANDPPVMRLILGRADKIVAQGHRIRADYRTANPASSVQAENSAQIGFLHATIRKLCDELDSKRRPHIDYDPDDLAGQIRDALPELEAALRYCEGYTCAPDPLKARKMMTQAIEFLEDAE